MNCEKILFLSMLIAIAMAFAYPEGVQDQVPDEEPEPPKQDVEETPEPNQEEKPEKPKEETPEQPQEDVDEKDDQNSETPKETPEDAETEKPEEENKDAVTEKPEEENKDAVTEKPEEENKDAETTTEATEASETTTEATEASETTTEATEASETTTEATEDSETTTEATEATDGTEATDATADNTEAVDTTDATDATDVTVTIPPGDINPENVFTDHWGNPLKDMEKLQLEMPDGATIEIWTEKWKTFYTPPPTKPGCMCLTRGPLSRFKLFGNIHFPKIKITPPRNTPSVYTEATTEGCPTCPPCECNCG